MTRRCGGSGVVRCYLPMLPRLGFLRSVLMLLCVAPAMLFAAACRNADDASRKRAPGAPAERVLVVVNRQSAASQEVGRYYMQQRGIPASHLVQVDVAPDDEISELAFRAKLVSPVRSAIDALPVRIDFIVLTTGVPIRIRGDRGYSVDAHLAGMKLSIPAMVGLDTTWLKRYRNPYYGSREPFDSDRFDMYLVTRLDCGVVRDCLALVDRATAARAVRGPFYFDAMPFSRATDGYGLMNRSLYAAAMRLQLQGLDVGIDTTARFVAPDVPVMGYASWGSNDNRFDSDAYHAMRFLPGALAETFVSTSARTFRPTDGGQSRIVDLIAQGVTGVKGYVSEPYTFALADPDIIFDRYLRGFTLAESFYAASRMVLWKDIVIGDPLCAPYWGQNMMLTMPVLGASPQASPLRPTPR